MTDEVDPTAMLKAVAMLMDVLRTLEESARGWRAYLTENGWPPEIANAMAGDLMAKWQAMVLSNLQSPLPPQGKRRR